MADHLPVADDPILFIDYDGTLAPIVDDPTQAYPHPEAPDLLAQLEERYPLWIVTGRGIRDLEPLLDMSLNAIGLHGAQQGTIGGEVERLTPDEAVRALQELRHSIPDVEGLSIEDKEQAFAVHYREADEDEVRDRLQSWADSMPDVLDAIWGKQVIELRPKGLDKGHAVSRISDDHPAHTPVYLGDDTTDEDAFRALTGRNGKAITIKVGNGDTEAQYRLSGPDEVMTYLKRYV